MVSHILFLAPFSPKLPKIHKASSREGRGTWTGDGGWGLIIGGLETGIENDYCSLGTGEWN